MSIEKPFDAWKATRHLCSVPQENIYLLINTNDGPIIELIQEGESDVVYIKPQQVYNAIQKHVTQGHKILIHNHPKWANPSDADKAGLGRMLQLFQQNEVDITDILIIAPNEYFSMQYNYLTKIKERDDNDH